MCASKLFGNKDNFSNKASPSFFLLYNIIYNIINNNNNNNNNNYCNYKLPRSYQGVTLKLPQMVMVCIYCGMDGDVNDY